MLETSGRYVKRILQAGGIVLRHAGIRPLLSAISRHCMLS
jgi:hypothetical protein